MFARLQNETLREVREAREDLRQDREAHRQFTAEMTLQLRQVRVESEAHIGEFRTEMREIREEFREEMRAQRQALLAILDRLPPPGEATA